MRIFLDRILDFPFEAADNLPASDSLLPTEDTRPSDPIPTDILRILPMLPVVPHAMLENLQEFHLFLQRGLDLTVRQH